MLLEKEKSTTVALLNFHSVWDLNYTAAVLWNDWVYLEFTIQPFIVRLVVLNWQPHQISLSAPLVCNLAHLSDSPLVHTSGKVMELALLQWSSPSVLNLIAIHFLMLSFQNIWGELRAQKRDKYWLMAAMRWARPMQVAVSPFQFFWVLTWNLRIERPYWAASPSSRCEREN